MKDLIKRIWDVSKAYRKSGTFGTMIVMGVISYYMLNIEDKYKILEPDQKTNEELKIDLYNQRKKVQDLQELKNILEILKGLEDFQDNYFRGNPYLDLIPKEKEVERVRYV